MFNQGDKVRWWSQRRQRNFKGTVVLQRRPTKTGRVWVQVKVTPSKGKPYAGSRSVKASHLELVA